MPTGRAALLLRRLSTGDNRFKNWTINQTSKEQLISSPACSHRDLGAAKRLSTFSHSHLAKPLLTRSYSDNIIKMSSPLSTEPTPTTKKHKHTNKLINEKSPYLLQHAHNPVDWYPWGQEAIDKAVNENKLIFLSIGYSTCHWCHVMEKESFENEEIAEVMNTHYINIKVDREERPDIDKIYMLFVMATTQSGGWPLSVFLTPELHPVTGGTYFPPEDRWGRPGFKSILLSLANKWKENKHQFTHAGNSIMEALQKMTKVERGEDSAIPEEGTWDKCIQRYIANYESEFGGFGTAPKFPQASIFNFLFHYYARDKHHPEGQKCLDMCLYTLSKIAKGGIHDHVAGGFARYSVDNEWHVPHFEKMLYDQAQLTIAYTDAYVATKDRFYSDIVHDIIKYVNRDLRHESGGYYSAEDADSFPHEGASNKKEGAFYVWKYSEIKSLLDGKYLHGVSYLDVFCEYFHIEEDGNVSPESDPHGELSNKNILIIYGDKAETAEAFELTPEEFEVIITDCLDILYDARQKRPRPHLDDKILCSWNGLMLSGLAKAGQGLHEKGYVIDAIATAAFIKEYLYDPETKTLIHSCYKDKGGNICQMAQPIPGFLDDYAFFIKGLLDLYEASLDTCWLDWARELQTKQNELFWDGENGGYFACTEDPTVVLRLKEDNDGAEPSGNSVSCHNLQRLGAYNDKTSSPEGGNHEREMAKKLLTAFSKRLTESPTALPEMMSALMFYHDTPTQVLIAGGRSDPRTLELIKVVRSRLLPGRVLAVADPTAEAPAGMSDLLLNRIFRATGDVPKAFVCRRYACSLPVSDVKQLENLLDSPPPLVLPKKKEKQENQEKV